MRTGIAIGCALALWLALAGALPAEDKGTPLSAAEMKQIYGPGVLLEISNHEKGTVPTWKGSAIFAGGGRALIQILKADGSTEQDSGLWVLQGDVICIQWSKFQGGITHCANDFHTGDNSFEQRQVPDNRLVMSYLIR
jgi:hypothetical protein